MIHELYIKIKIYTLAWFENQLALEKDRYKIHLAFIATQENSLIVSDSMLDASRAGGDFHLRTATNMYPHIHEAVEKAQVLLEWHLQPTEEKPSCLICWTFVL
uniref:DNA polymerase I A, chloroplastic/mitochondrial-like n=1 Tax=Nicotiana sylvestris TaxID=4096 RepID=A0A1U7Y052_NICSY|nr:PREDICTED: DNA polymerase I A, chloroplastic/mitochondrial-like [Nicotiana sylvestris]